MRIIPIRNLPVRTNNSALIFWLIIFLLIDSCVFADAAASPPGFNLSVDSNTVQLSVSEFSVEKSGQYDRISIPGLSHSGAPGAPSLPVKTVNFLIPYGYDFFAVRILRGQKKLYPGSFYLEPVQVPMEIAESQSQNPAEPDPGVYNSNDPYPGTLFSIAGTQNLRGYRILIINIHPIEYIPNQKKIYYYENIELAIDLERVSNLDGYELYRGTSADKKNVQWYVDNPENINTYPRIGTAALESYTYLIITNNTLNAAAGTYKISDLVSHKQTKWGLTVKVETVEDIYANPAYAGADSQEEIRNCIKYYYQNYQTEYVLLVGDGDGSNTGFASGETEAAWIIPYRGFYAQALTTSGTRTDANIPADMYYACLDGTFNYDGDSNYGETNDGLSGGEIDLFSEVYVGRAPVDSATELSNFVKKVIAYENSNGAYLTEVCFAGEDLDSSTTGKSYMEEIRLGSSSHGYSTVGMNGTGYFNYTTLYDSDLTWTKTNLITIMNNGVHVVNHIAHASNAIFTKTFANLDADSLTNTDYFFIYTQGCYSGSFDNRESSGSYGTDDCILEHFIGGSGGAFAAIGNSRYGYYAEGSTDGASQRYHREFWDAVVKEGIVHLGKAMQDAKEDSAGVINDSGANRWCYFEINLLGDPHTPITAALLSPTDFTATSVAFADSSWITVRWKNSSRADLSGTMIRYRTDGTYPVDQNDGYLLCNRALAPGTSDMINHTGIIPGLTYYYVGFGYDASAVYEGGTSTQNRAFAQAFGTGSSGNSGRSDCFIATVCFGDFNCPQVRSLRKFRDKILVKSSPTKPLVDLYYLVGPKMAGYVQSHPDLKEALRTLLTQTARILDHYLN